MKSALLRLCAAPSFKSQTSTLATDPAEGREAGRLLSLGDMGRVFFEVARSAASDGYRDPFLAGAEAAVVMGDQAEAYLARRNQRALEDSLVTLGALIPEAAAFRGVEQTGPDRVAMIVSAATGPRVLIDIGSGVRLVSVFRLREPPSPG